MEDVRRETVKFSAEKLSGGSGAVLLRVLHDTDLPRRHRHRLRSAQDTATII